MPVGGEPPGSATYFTEIDVGLVFVFRLVIVAFAVLVAGLSFAVRIQILVGIVALFLQQGGVVTLAFFVILHPVVAAVGIRCPPAINLETALCAGSGGEALVVNPHIVAGDVILEVVAVSQIEGSVGILVAQVVLAGFILEKISVIGFAVPPHAVYSQRGVAHGQHLKFAVFIARIKDKCPLVVPFQSLLTDIVGTWIHHLVVLPIVLGHHRIDLFL